MTITFTTLKGLKSRAKSLKKAEDITHTEALERVAREGGYGSYRDAHRALGGAA